jgi:hypothetical protein
VQADVAPVATGVWHVIVPCPPVTTTVIANPASHTPLSQMRPAAHSVLAPQLAKQALPLHTYAPQLCGAAAGQLPAPSQLTASVADPFEHVAARHSADGYVHAFALVPLHVPPQPNPPSVQAVRPPIGAPVTGEQVPAVPA